MRVVEYVPHGVLILKVASRSRPGRKTHFLSVVYGEGEDVDELSCSCEGFSYRGQCHHAASVEDLIGGVP